MVDPGGRMADWIPVFSSGLVLKATIVLGIAWVVTSLLRRGAASHRHIVWTAGLLAASALPLLSGNLPEVRLSVPGRVSEILNLAIPGTDAARGSTPDSEQGRARGPVTGGIGDASRRSADPVPESDGASTASGLRPDDRSGGVLAGIPLRRALTWIWWVGTGLLFLFWLRGRWVWHRLRIAASPATSDAIVGAASQAAEAIGLRRDLEILISDEIDIPVTWGTWSPVILLPTKASSWPVRRLLSVLAHELSHVRRHDHLARQVAAVSVAIYWFHPLAWLAAHRAQVESEHACDDEVVLSGVDRFDYAEDLVVLARGFAGRTVPRYAATAARSWSQLRRRIHALLDPGKRRDTLGPLKATVPVLSAGTVACLLAIVEPTAPDALSVASAESPSTVPAEHVVDREASHRRVESPSDRPFGGSSECWRPDRTDNRNSNRNEEDGVWRLEWESPGCRSEISVTGALVTSPGFERLVRLAPGSRLEIVEQVRGEERALRVWGDQQGSPNLELHIAGRPVRRLTAPHRAWLSDRLALLHDETGGSAVVVEP